ncbi:MAG: helix-turn-helix domain-containing protein [Deltaproteobacteria bacterium]
MPKSLTSTDLRLNGAANALLPGVAERLRAARVAAGLTGRDVLERTGVDPGNLSRMERNKRVPTMEVLARLALLYGVPMASLIGPESDPAPEPLLGPDLTLAAFLARSDPDEAEEVRRRWSSSADLRRNGRRFAYEVFAPVRAVLGVPLVVTAGLGLETAGEDRECVCHQPHHLALSADVVPVGMCLPVAVSLLAKGVRAGSLDALDEASVEGDSHLHLLAAAEGAVPRRLVTGAQELCRWGLLAEASRKLIP